jgi:pimeloyl-ACP methyl ester carboxylesterase
VHGAANDHSVWALQSRYFAHHGFNVIALDLPGHGRSEGPALLSAEAIAQWIVRTLDAAEVASATLVGHSLGALACLAATASAPARVGKLALLGPRGSDAGERRAPRRGEGRRSRRLRAHQRLVAQRGAQARRQSGARHVDDRRGAASHGAHAARRALHRSVRLQRVRRRACRAASVRCPTLVVLGQRDLMAPPKSASAMCEALADCRAVTLAGAGHAMMAEQPDAVLDALRAFV